MRKRAKSSGGEVLDNGSPPVAGRRDASGAPASIGAASLDEFHPADYNPRTISPQAADGLAESIREFGDLSGLVVNKRTGNIVAGHQRSNVLRQDLALGVGGITWLREVVVDLGPAENRFQSRERHGYLHTPAGDFAVREVDWPVAFERAANLSANNPLIAGEFTVDAAAMIESLQFSAPQQAERLRLDDLLATLPRVADAAAPPSEDPEPESAITKSTTCPKCGTHFVIGEVQ